MTLNKLLRIGVAR